MESNKEQGKRFNSGKTRIDLVPAWAVEQIAKVFTFGAKKYGEKNWEKGMPWSDILPSLERHLNAIKQGEDFDKESGMLHAAHLGCNILMLLEYYKIYPQGDNRTKNFTKDLRIAIDIDGVIADFTSAYIEWHKTLPAHHWETTYEAKKHWEIIDSKQDEFWVETVKPLFKGKDMPFEPVCYVTARRMPKQITEKWLEKHEFPCVPVFSNLKSKVQTLKDQNIDIFVDDAYHNFVEINNAGILCYLMDAPYNRKYDVGHLRITSLQDIVTKNNLIRNESTEA